MNYTAKGLLIFLLGAAVGALIEYQMLTDKYEKEMDEQYEALAEEFGIKPEYAAAHEPKMIDPVELAEYQDRARKYAPTNYNKPSIETVSGQMLDAEESPYLIDVHEFNRGFGDNVSLTYYAEDDTLVDDGTDDVVTNVTDLLGDALTRFGEDASDPDIVYVRNPRLDIDYEVARLYKSYSVTVLGLEPDSPSRKQVKRDSRE